MTELSIQALNKMELLIEAIDNFKLDVDTMNPHNGVILDSHRVLKPPIYVNEVILADSGVMNVGRNNVFTEPYVSLSRNRLHRLGAYYTKIKTDKSTIDQATEQIIEFGKKYHEYIVRGILEERIIIPPSVAEKCARSLDSTYMGFYDQGNGYDTQTSEMIKKILLNERQNMSAILKATSLRNHQPKNKYLFELLVNYFSMAIDDAQKKLFERHNYPSSRLSSTTNPGKAYKTDYHLDPKFFAYAVMHADRAKHVATFTGISGLGEIIVQGVVNHKEYFTKNIRKMLYGDFDIEFFVRKKYVPNNLRLTLPIAHLSLFSERENFYFSK